MSGKRVKICTGPGCRAWDAEKITRQVGTMQEDLRERGYRVSYVPCMNQCGGGACVQVQPGKQLFKIQAPREIRRVLLPEACQAVA